MSQIQLKFDRTAVDGWLATIPSEFPDAEFKLLATQVGTKVYSSFLKSTTWAVGNGWHFGLFTTHAVAARAPTNG